MTDTLQQVLDTPGCERLRDFAAVGPAQRAALELFVDRVGAEIGASMNDPEHLKIMMQHSAWDGRLNLDDAIANIDEFFKSYSVNARLLKALESAVFRLEQYDHAAAQRALRNAKAAIKAARKA